jgi:hypothetical protein
MPAVRCMFRPRSLTSTFGHRPQDPPARHVARYRAPPNEIDHASTGRGAQLCATRQRFRLYLMRHHMCRWRIIPCLPMSSSAPPVDPSSNIEVSRRPATLRPARYASRWPSVYTQHPVSFSPLVLCAVASHRVQSQRWSNGRLLRNRYRPGHSNGQLIVVPGSSVMLHIRGQLSQDCSAYNAPGGA